MSVIEKVDTHETRYTGTLEGKQLKKLIKEAIREEIGMTRYTHGLTLEFTFDLKPGQVLTSGDLPDVSFTMIQDHDWHRKPSLPDED